MICMYKGEEGIILFSHVDIQMVRITRAAEYLYCRVAEYPWHVVAKWLPVPLSRSNCQSRVNARVVADCRVTHLPSSREAWLAMPLR